MWSVIHLANLERTTTREEAETMKNGTQHTPKPEPQKTEKPEPKKAEPKKAEPLSDVARSLLPPTFLAPNTTKQ